MSADTESFVDGRSNLQTVLSIDFGVAGVCREFVAGGWSTPEAHLRWMTGLQSELHIRRGLGDGDHLIELDLEPFLEPPVHPTQQLTIAVNGITVGNSRFTHDGRFGYRIPAAALAGSCTTTILFTHPDAARPCDVRASSDARWLALAVKRLRISRIRVGATGLFRRGNGGLEPGELEQRVGMDPARLMLRFESLGDNCEFGLVQRRCGAEPFLSLLRFAGMELPTLLRSLDLGLESFGDPANVEIRLDDKEPPEFVTHELRYGAFFHTFRQAGEIDAARLHDSESKRLRLCAQRFIADLKRGNKIFVVKRNEPLQEEEILPLFAALSSHGPSQLLWMVPADHEHPSGSVELVMPGLFKGFIDRFAPHDDAPDLLFEHWLEVCANAYELAQKDLRSTVG